MACVFLCGRSPLSKEQISEKCAKRNRNHNPAVVGHENKHEHKGIKVLQGVQDGLDEVGALVGLSLGLSGGGADAVIERLLIATGDGAKGFVADGEDDDGDEREEERSCRADVPLTEDNAKVVGIPGEEHVHTAHVFHVSSVMAMVHISMVHTTVIHV